MTIPYERLSLLKTVKDLHEAGTVKLSDSDRVAIESETTDLINRSVMNKSAMKTPEGFEQVLEELRQVGDADEAFQVVLDFLKSEGVVEVEDEAGEAPEAEMDLGGGSPDMDDAGGDKPFPPKKDEDGDDETDERDTDDDTGDKPFPPKQDGGKGDGKGKGMGKGKKPVPSKGDGGKDKKAPSFEKKDEVGDSFVGGDEGMKDEREALLRRAQDQENSDSGIAALQEKKKEESEGAPSKEEMGVEDTDMTMTARAKKIKIAITKERNLVAQHEDYGPVFLATPTDTVKGDRNALVKLANRVYGLAVYKGFKAAARLCNATLLKDGGVDDDVITDAQVEISPETDPVTAEGESDVREEQSTPDDNALAGNEVDTREKPPTVSDTKTKMIAKRRRLAAAKDRWAARKRLEGKDILDDADGVTKEMKPSKPSGDSTNDAEDNAKDGPGSPAGDVLADAENDIRGASVKENMTKLYQARLEKRLAAEKEQFVRKFTRAVRLAATRMLLNHEEHPLKVAAVDVLTARDVTFTNDEKFSGMDVGTAVELTELITREGHDQFMQRLLSRAADLLEKDDRYLADAEEDLEDQAPVPVGEGISTSTATRRSARNRRSSKIRREAAEGNFERNQGAPSSAPVEISTNIRGAISGDTKLGRRLSKFTG